jgi:hypothetical protein
MGADPPPEVHRLYFDAEADLGGGWCAGWAIDDGGDRWPVVVDRHLEDWAPILMGPALDDAAPHDALD